MRCDGLKCCGNRQNAILAISWCSLYGTKFGFALGQCTCLVKCHGAHSTNQLQPGSALDQKADLCRPRQCRRNSRRCRDHQGTRAANQKQGQTTINPFFPALAKQQRRDYDRRQGKAHNDRGIDAGKLGNKPFNRRLVLFALLNQLNHAVQHRMPGGPGDRNPYRAVCYDGTGKDFRADFAINGNGFTCQVTVIDLRRTGFDHAIGWHTLAGAHFNDIADCKLVWRNGLKPVACDPSRSLRRQLHQCLNAASCPPRSNTFEAFTNGKQQHNHPGLKAFANRHRTDNGNRHQKLDREYRPALRQTDRLFHHGQRCQKGRHRHGIWCRCRDDHTNQPPQRKTDCSKRNLVIL